MRNFYKVFKIVFICFFCIIKFSNSTKREFRGAWIASVANLDWPTSPTNSTQKNKDDLILLLDNLKSAGVNAVIFQIRSECDALYNSSLEPWSYWLTGQQGVAPSPNWDPLEFAVEESHKRGIEFHAWFNPFRAVRGSGYANSSNHVSVKNPNWILTFGTLKMLNPGLPEVRNHVLNVIMDVVRRYNIDGVHWDDYFYPYPTTSFPSGITSEDVSTFNTYNRGFFDIKDWRRDNINLLIKAVHDSINAIKPTVKFGISPFGIYKNGVPQGIVGLDAYNILYTDVVHWLQNQWLDYFTPQLYWGFGGGQDYATLMPWWAAQKNNRHFYPGLAPYRIIDSNWPSSTVTLQVRLNRANPNAEGEIFFRANQGITNNPKGFLDSLKQNLYFTRAITPLMSWKDNVKPNPPQNLRYEALTATSPAVLIWDAPQTASDGDVAQSYLIYHFKNNNPQVSDFENPINIVDVVGIKNKNLSPPNEIGENYFALTTIDRAGNESLPSNILQIISPTIPQLSNPVNFAMQLPPTINFIWQKLNNASEYNLQISESENFSPLTQSHTHLSDTFFVVTNLLGQKKYFWRVSAANAGGSGNFSAIREFTTGFPAVPNLIYPNNYAQGIPTNLRFNWDKTLGAKNFRFQLATSADYNSIVKDSSIIDTSISVQTLLFSKIYFWRVSASNDIGTSQWSEARRFLTVSTFVEKIPSSEPKDFVLKQNFPNPFNPTTQIEFTLWKTEFVKLTIYDLLGREIAILVNKELSAGNYRYSFVAKNITSGIYYYQLQAGDTTEIRKMIFYK